MVTCGVQEMNEEPSIVVIAIDRRVADAVGRHVKDAIGKETPGTARHAEKRRGAPPGEEPRSGILTPFGHEEGQSLHRTVSVQGLSLLRFAV
jgi:hypothetical protein